MAAAKKQTQERRLASFVHVTTPEGVKVFGPGDDVPAEFAELITNPKAWASETDESVDDEPTE